MTKGLTLFIPDAEPEPAGPLFWRDPDGGGWVLRLAYRLWLVWRSL